MTANVPESTSAAPRLRWMGLLMGAAGEIHVLPPAPSIRSPVPELGEGKLGLREKRFAKMACCAKE